MKTKQTFFIRITDQYGNIKFFEVIGQEVGYDLFIHKSCHNRYLISDIKTGTMIKSFYLKKQALEYLKSSLFKDEILPAIERTRKLQYYIKDVEELETYKNEKN